jgi:hypothetical protein
MCIKNDETGVYDDFDNPSGMIKKDKWNTWELVRQSNKGLLESELTRYGSNGTNNMSFVNSQDIFWILSFPTSCEPATG